MRKIVDDQEQISTVGSEIVHQFLFLVLGAFIHDLKLLSQTFIDRFE